MSRIYLLLRINSSKNNPKFTKLFLFDKIMIDLNMFKFWYNKSIQSHDNKLFLISLSNNKRILTVGNSKTFLIMTLLIFLSCSLKELYISSRYLTNIFIGK